METIQVVIDEKLLEAADRVARQTKVNRSELVRRALREHLDRVKTLELEERDRRGYQQAPEQTQVDESATWESQAVWPEE